jgi:subtilisin family serine protease
LGSTSVPFYIIDTGCLTTHEEFASNRAVGIGNTVDDTGTEDGNGHGTCTSSLGVGVTYGPAKDVDLYMTKGLNDQGEGTDFTVASAVSLVCLPLLLPCTNLSG